MKPQTERVRAIVIGVSAGGLNALRNILPKLPQGFPLPVIIVQHLSPDSDGYMVHCLDQCCPLTVKEVDEKENNGRGDYEIVYYAAFTDEGNEVKFRRLLNMDGVTAGDNKPSVIMVPGFSNNFTCYNLNNRYSIAKDLADKGNWTYLFDPRGVGVNAGRFDPDYTVDSLIDHDLPAALNFITKRSCGKPSILMGHSMGGLVSENMVLNWALRLDFDKIKLPDRNKRDLDKVLVPQKVAKDSLKTVKGVISLGSPRCLDRHSHVFFPSAL